MIPKQSNTEQVKAPTTSATLRRGVVRVVKEPLIQFLFLGFLLFIGFDLINRGDGTSTNRIVVDNGVVADILVNYTNAWGRQPTTDEMHNLIESYVREEILYRQGVAMGLQDDDSVVRRRVRQKMDVIGEESEDELPATDAQLQIYLKQHARSYAVQPLFSFKQVFIDPALHGAETQRVFEAAKAKLVAGGDTDGIGDPTMLPTSEKDQPIDQIGHDFGEEFTEGLTTLPTGQWDGPVRSGYGLHLVLITDRKPGRTPELAEVRQAVQRDWENDRREHAADVYYAKVRKDYKVVVIATFPDQTKPEISQR